MTTNSISLSQTFLSGDRFQTYLQSRIDESQKIISTLNELPSLSKTASVVKNFFDALFWTYPYLIFELLEDISNSFPSLKKRVTTLKISIDFKYEDAIQRIKQAFDSRRVTVSHNMLSSDAARKLIPNEPYKVHPELFTRRPKYFEKDELFFSKMTTGICGGMCDWFTILLSSQTKDFKTLNSDFEKQLIRTARFFENHGSEEAAIFQGLNSIKSSTAISMISLLPLYDSHIYHTFLPLEKTSNNRKELTTTIENLPMGIYRLYLPKHATILCKFSNNKSYIFDPDQGLIQLKNTKDSTTAKQFADFVSTYLKSNSLGHIMLCQINSLEKGEVLHPNCLSTNWEQLSPTRFKTTNKTTRWPKLQAIFFFFLKPFLNVLPNLQKFNDLKNLSTLLRKAYDYK